MDHSRHSISPQLAHCLKQLAAERIPAQVLLAWYEELLPASKDCNEQNLWLAQTNAQPMECGNDQVQFGCPWCGTNLKLAKDFIRHAKQKCCAVQEFRCPDCSKSFARRERFTTHHKRAHHLRCGSGPCSHAPEAQVTLQPKQILGCGFCYELFDMDLHGYLRHLIYHYRQGKSLSDWTAGPHVPVTRLPTPSQALKGIANHTMAWGSALVRQTINPPGTFGTDISLFGSHDTMDLPAGDPDSQVNNAISPILSPYERHQASSLLGDGRSAFIQAENIMLQDQDCLQGVGGHLYETDASMNVVDDAYAMPGADQGCRIQSGVAETDTCAHLVAEVEFANSFQNNEWALPLNPTESLPQARHRKKSLSNHVLHALQSLPTW